MELRKKLLEKKAVQSVIGLGYVGLPLAVEFAGAGLDTVGIDISGEKVDLVNSGKSYIGGVGSADLANVVRSGKLRATLKFEVLKDVDTINICVPTPLRKTKDPDISYIVSAVKKIRENLRKGQLIILESTTYPGTTDEVILPLLEDTGLAAGKDFYLAFSPERVDPGNREFTTKNIPKVDPFYLSWKAKQSGFEARFIELSGMINSEMPLHVVNRVSEALNEQRKCVNGSRILIMGVSYKEGINDTRESPAYDIIRQLQQRGAEICCYDTHVKELEGMEDVPDFEYTPGNIKAIDCAIIVTGHNDIDYGPLVENSPLIFDSRNVLKGIEGGNIVRL